MPGTSDIASARAHQRTPEPHMQWFTVWAFVVGEAWSLLILKVPTSSIHDQHAMRVLLTHAHLRRSGLRIAC